LSIIDPLVPVSDSTVDSIGTFDHQGRSQAARYAEAALAILRADRQLAQTSNDLLVMVLSAAVSAQDTLDVPIGGRGFYAPSVNRTLLEDLVREVNGALSIALASVDEAGVKWHESAVAALAARSPTEPQDFLQQLFVSLKSASVENQSAIAPRVLRDVLSRHLRQSGAGEKEAEVWLAFGMSMMERCESLSRTS
jgi:hypothetical protein